VADAVTASTRCLAWLPALSVNGMRWIDGGVRSAKKADLLLPLARLPIMATSGIPRMRT